MGCSKIILRGDGGRAWRFAALLLTLLSVGRLSAATLQFDVFLGFDGTVREASWFPVVCEIRNSGPAISGYIEVAAGGSKAQSQIMPVELPTGTLKRITIPVFAYSRYGSRWDVRLLNERRKVIEEKSALTVTRQVAWDTPIMGSLARTASGAPAFRPILRQQAEGQPATARILPDIFPDNPIVLEALGSIYLSSEVAAKLTSPQVNALLGWLNAGGNLIVGVEQVADVNGLPWLRNVLPVELKDTATISDHSQFQDWLRSGDYLKNMQQGSLARSTRPGMSASQPFSDLAADSKFELADLGIVNCSVRDGRVDLASGGKPLIVTGNRGLGKVTTLLFSPEREPFKSWKNLTAFWSALGEVPGELYTSTDYFPGYGKNADAVFGAMVDSRQVHKLPKGWLFALLVVYLVVIGPLDQWWLKRIRRPMLTWITFPCYVAIFSGLIYVIGYKLRAGDSEYNEVHVVDVLANGERTEFRGRTFASIYSPANASFPMQCAEKPATFRGECTGSGGGMATEGFEAILNGDTFKADVFVPVWTSQVFISDWWQSGSAPVLLEVKSAGNGWAVTVRNTSRQPISHAVVVIGDRAVVVGALTPGQSRTQTVNPAAGISLGGFVQANGGTFAQVVDSRLAAFGDSERGVLHDLPNAAMAASFMDLLSDRGNYNSFVITPGLDLGPVVARGNAVLLAWMPDHAPTKSLNQISSKRTFRHTLWRVTVPVAARL